MTALRKMYKKLIASKINVSGYVDVVTHTYTHSHSVKNIFKVHLAAMELENNTYLHIL